MEVRAQAVVPNHRVRPIPEHGMQELEKVLAAEAELEQARWMRHKPAHPDPEAHI
jgi:hypothetical protein